MSSEKDPSKELLDLQAAAYIGRIFGWNFEQILMTVVINPWLIGSVVCTIKKGSEKRQYFLIKRSE